MTLTLPSVRLILSQVSYPGYTFEVLSESGRMFLRVGEKNGSCNVTGQPMSWWGRKWRLSPHMTDGEVVGTAFKAVLTALEHEARERFTFKDAAVYDSHVDIYKLVELRKAEGVLQERSHTPPPHFKAHLFGPSWGPRGILNLCRHCGLDLQDSDGVTPCPEAP